jgi:hypothetical protein
MGWLWERELDSAGSGQDQVALEEGEFIAYLRKYRFPNKHSDPWSQSVEVRAVTELRATL